MKAQEHLINQIKRPVAVRNRQRRDAQDETIPTKQFYMKVNILNLMLLIKNNAQISHSGRESDVMKRLAKCRKINLRYLNPTTEPNKLGLIRIQLKTVCNIQAAKASDQHNLINYGSHCRSWAKNIYICLAVISRLMRGYPFRIECDSSQLYEE